MANTRWLALALALTLALALALALAIIRASQRESYFGGTSSSSSDAVKTWDPIEVGGSAEPRPLLELALQRVASRMNASYRVGKPLRIGGAWGERESGAGKGMLAVNRWYRWSVGACFFTPQDDFGRCYTLDVRARADWKPASTSKPPTEWPVELGGDPAPIVGPPLPVADMIL